MTRNSVVDGLLVQWGDRLFYPDNRMVSSHCPRLHVKSTAERADLLRRHIALVVQRSVPQVMVKVTGGGRGMLAIAAHFRYISKHGRLVMEDDRAELLQGKESLRGLAEEWRYAGSLIPDEGSRREAMNIMLSMPRGTDPLVVLRASREFAQTELAGHQYVMVLHDHQANPHVHLSVRVESREGRRLNARKSDLTRWREVFAEKLRGWGVEAAASSRWARGAVHNYEPLWKIKARQTGRFREVEREFRGPDPFAAVAGRRGRFWGAISNALDQGDRSDKALAAAVRRYLESASTGDRSCEKAVRRSREQPALHPGERSR